MRECAVKMVTIQHKVSVQKVVIRMHWRTDMATLRTDTNAVGIPFSLAIQINSQATEYHHATTANTVISDKRITFKSKNIHNIPLLIMIIATALQCATSNVLVRHTESWQIVDYVIIQVTNVLKRHSIQLNAAIFLSA